MAEAVGLAAAIAQLAGLTVELTKLSYTYLNDVRNASKARKMYLREVSALTDVLLRLEMSLQDSVALGPQQSARSNPIPSTTISDCHDVLSLQRSALEKNFNRLLWPFHEKELKKAIEKVHRFRDIFSDYITADTSSKLSFTNHKVDSLKSDQARVQLQDGLEQTEGLSKTQPTPISGTGQWLVNHTDFQEWIKGPPSVLWCRGPRKCERLQTYCTLMN
ncbi:hypothetical protein K491DRAFT_355337 [Lophiostoma macrostomum CBS 122681]|uniref:Fungal N-terminal domain-containing protein n=1 Tax=Lophiostoma macrostomum CBS 122681 TaxID=1314788 RepID=A0A6A6TAS1_9PLEO|nr:hypothetical protein K491DRAFT_355337 [Lophiostoma macrostomum CBS 122681]